MKHRAQPHILLLQLEFPTWAQARAWTYPACFGVAEGLRAAGAACTTVPLLANTSLAPEAWLVHAREAVAGKRFDQVWVWLVHAPLASSVLEWIASLAPVRVGIVMESLTYDEADYAWAGHLRSRMQAVVEQSRVLTHVLVPDERDVEPLAGQGGVRTLWWPTMVPVRFIVPAGGPPRWQKGVFHGHPYGPRQAWLTDERLRSRMTFEGPGAPLTRFQTWFDQLQAAALKRLAEPASMTARQMAEYVAMLQEVREGEFREWMAQLPQWAAVVNLPSLAKFYGGRVYEGMAAGRPVLTYPVPDHPLNNALFTDGEDVLMFAPDNPDSLAECLERAVGDPDAAQCLADNAQRRLRRYHTTEVRLAETLRWIESGDRPEYGVGRSVEAAERRQPTEGEGYGGQIRTTVFVLSVDDPAFPSCQAALDRQEGAAFGLEVIRNVCPFSAAAQKMITTCSTEFFIQVDEDMVLNADAIASMEAVMRAAPDDVGMICFHLFDEDREIPIQGVKIYRTALMKPFAFQDVKASEMDLLEQMGRHGIRWILHPDIKGRHGTHYTPETIYRRYKTMYEKDIRQWNVLTSDLRKKAERFRETGDPLQLFALLGAAHGIIEAPRAADREKDARRYELPEIEIFQRLLTGSPPASQPYDITRPATALPNPPIVAAPGDKPVSPTAPTAPLRVLIVTPYFWPSVGGVETVAADLGAGLASSGVGVDVACYRDDKRTASLYRGMKIIEVAQPDSWAGGLPAAAIEVRDLVASNRYDACILVGAPTNSMFFAILELPDLSARRIVLQPTINQEVADFLRTNTHARSLLKRLAQVAAAVISLGQETFDARFCREEGIPVTVLPNGTPVFPPLPGFRAQHKIPPDRFLILHVANLYRVKNHLGLLDALQELPPGAVLAVIGRPTHETAYVEEVRKRLAARSDILFISDLDRQGVAAAIQAADLVVLSSDTEVSPLCLLEAMSMQRPWLATPGCGTAGEQAGGLVLPLNEFPRAIKVLMAHPDYRARLARAGYEHWQACYQWTSVLAGWLALIREGRLPNAFCTPDAFARIRDRLREEYRPLGAISLGQPLNGSNMMPPEAAPTALPAVTHHPAPNPTLREVSMDQDRFYVDMFVNSPAWSRPEPNHDEAARWSKIAGFLEHILRRVERASPGKTLRILEVGCGRGWLSNLATMYGTVEGVEPVAGVIDHARKLFPHIRFEAGTARTVLARNDFSPYDVVLCSEVIEHVPHPEKAEFLRELHQLLSPDGYVILTTPRGEMWERWQTIAPPCQPIEDWVTERQLEDLLTGQGFATLGVERIYVEVPSLRYIPAPTPHDLNAMNLLPIYQVWAAQRTGTATTSLRPAMSKTPMVSVVIPTHNRPDRLRRAIDSVLQQTYQDFQIIVVNDGATSVEAVVADMNKDGHITLVTHDRNRGLAASRNTGIRQATGKYVCYLDDDDRFLPDHLETLVTALESSDYKVAYTNAWRVHERETGGTVTEVGRDCPYSYEFNPHRLLVSNYIPVLCFMHARVCLAEAGTFDESLFVHEDWDLWIRMATRYPFLHIAKTTAEFSWRMDGSTMSSQSRRAFFRTTEIIYRKYAPYAALYPQIYESQQQRLKDLQGEDEKPRFVCSIVIPVWNKVDLTRQCLEALGPATEDVPFEVIIVDNGSTDGTSQLLNSLGGDVRIITNQTNLGFAKACNQGAAAATGEYLVFLNNDTIPLKGWLSALVEEVRQRPDIAIVGSKLLYRDRTVQHAGVAVDRLSMTPYHIYRGFPDDHPAVNKRRELNAVTGACLLIRKDVFEEVQGFDEAYVNGFEDVDLCFKVREKGRRIVYQPRSVLYHLESQTPGRKAHDLPNAVRLSRRWGRNWWLVDDDSLYLEDGYRTLAIEKDGVVVNELRLLMSEQERQAWGLVAEMQRAAGRRDEAAVVQFLACATEWPDDRSLLRWAATVAEALDRPDLAGAFHRRIPRCDDPVSGELDRIRQGVRDGELGESAQRLATVLANSPNHGGALLLRGVICMQQEQYAEADAAFSASLRHGGDAAKCWKGRAMAAIGMKDYTEAWQHASSALSESPDDHEAAHWLLRAGAELERWPALADVLAVFRDRNPGALDVRFALAGALVRAGRLADAQREYLAIQTLAPTYDGLEELRQAIAEREHSAVMHAVQS